MSLLDPVLDLFRGRTITVPPLDGAFRPDTRLDEASALTTVHAPDALAQDRRGGVLVSSGAALLRLDLLSGSTVQLAAFDASITALTRFGADEFLVGLDDGRLLRLDNQGRASPIRAPDVSCPVAMLALDSNTVLVAQGSSTRRPSEWARDLLERNASGAVWRLDLRQETARPLAADLAFPYGLAMLPDQTVIVAESWRHRLLRIPLTGGRPEPVLTALPGYPARLSPASGGGWWLALFAPRNRLIEFVLDEPRYRRAMLASVPPEHWIAPSLVPTHSFLDPLQCGAVRTMGVSKAWAPTRSYGLVVRLDERFRPVKSLHSRANGSRHGVTDVLDIGGRLLISAKGAGLILDAGPGAEPQRAVEADVRGQPMTAGKA